MDFLASRTFIWFIEGALVLFSTLALFGGILLVRASRNVQDARSTNPAHLPYTPLTRESLGRRRFRVRTAKRPQLTVV